MTRRAGLRLLAVVLALLACPPAASAQAESACGGDPAYRALDFWLGEWEVYVEDTLVGTNRIEKVLGGCAIVERWRSSAGGEGRSLFYYEPAQETWKQVWVTGAPAAPGGVKEKVLVETLPDGSLRFQGTVRLVEGGTYEDRTTLTPLEDGRVRQVIEVSGDGRSWDARFDGIYVPVGG